MLVRKCADRHETVNDVKRHKMVNNAKRYETE